MVSRDGCMYLLEFICLKKFSAFQCLLGVKRSFARTRSKLCLMSLAFSALIPHGEDVSVYYLIHKVASRQWTKFSCAQITIKTRNAHTWKRQLLQVVSSCFLFFLFFQFLHFFFFSSCLYYAFSLNEFSMFNQFVSDSPYVLAKWTFLIIEKLFFFLHCISLILKQFIAIVSTIITPLRAYSDALKSTFDFFCRTAVIVYCWLWRLYVALFICNSRINALFSRV